MPKLNPLIIILINLIMPVVSALATSIYTTWYFAGFSLLILLYFGLFRRAVKFIAFVSVAYALYIYMTEISFLAYIASMFFITFMFVPVFILSGILITEYNSSELISGLERLFLPKVFIIALTVSLRYIVVFKREFVYIKESMRIRGTPLSLRNPVRSFRNLITPQLFRCLILSEELTSAGLVKGISSREKRTSFYKKNFGIIDFLAVLIFLAGLIGVELWMKL